MPLPHVLDDPVAASLRGAHAHLTHRRGRVLRYQPDVATFTAMPVDPGPRDWDDLADLVGAGALADLFVSAGTPPPDWSPVFSLAGSQMIAAAHHVDHVDHVEAGDPHVVTLSPDDLPEMLALVHATAPGPFWPRTPAMGEFVGIRSGGELVAMAGERLRPPGWTEISAVCTAPAARGRGYAARLVRVLGARILARGERPFLHVVAGNDSAIELYRRLGFGERRRVQFRGFRPRMTGARRGASHGRPLSRPRGAVQATSSSWSRNQTSSRESGGGGRVGATDR